MYSLDQKKKIKEKICFMLDQALNEHIPKGVPIWKSILFILHKFMEPNFTGVVSIRIDAGKCYGPRVEEERPNLDTMFEEVLDEREG